jgi:molybdenum cofactor guanylyltransferase
MAANQRLGESNPQPSLGVIILAGGQSRRMGQDKALLPLAEGQTLLGKTVQLAQQLASQVVVVTPWPDRYRPLLPATVHLIHERPEASAFATGSVGAGPLGAFALGWQQLSTDWCLLLACDMPCLAIAPLQHWWQWIVSQPSDSDLDSAMPMASLVAQVGGSDRKRWEPFCGFYRRSCERSLQTFLQPSLNRTPLTDKHSSRSPSFQAWLSTVFVLPYESLPAALLFNCNTPTDWATVQQTNMQQTNMQKTK